MAKASTAQRELTKLRRDVAELQALLEQLCSAVYTHTRTDIAPDAALPQMRRLLREIRRRRPRAIIEGVRIAAWLREASRR